MTPLRQKYGQTVIYILLLATVIIIMAGTRRCDRGMTLPAITQGDSRGDTIDVGIVYGPMSYYVYNDTLGGLNLDMLNAMKNGLGRPVRLWPVVSLHDALRRLEKGNFDMLASLPSDNSIKQRFLTSRSVFLDRLVLIQLTDSNGEKKVKSALDLGNDTVYIPKESPAAARLANLSNEIGTQIPTAQRDDLSEEYLCMMVGSGKIPLAVVNEKTARSMQKEYPRLSFDSPVSFTQFQVWLFARGDTALRTSVDRWLDDYQSTPAYKELIRRY